jgi:hypothetical protein
MKITYVDKPAPLEELVAEHRKNPRFLGARKINFSGAPAFHDVYNISQEFTWEGRAYIAGRVEKRESELSAVILFEKAGDNHYRATDIVLPDMQDPFVTFVDGEIILGGTEITINADHIVSWRTALFKSRDLVGLEKFAVAPEKMKDVRLAKSDRIYVFTRPQGGEAKAGRIGFIVCDDLREINPDLINKAPLLTTQFTEDCWGGVNQVHVLKNGLLGIVGHIAKMSPGDVRHYYGMVFAFNPKTAQSTKVKIICERRDFPAGAYKRPDLIDVVFTGGLNRHPDGTATLYAGLSDAEACAAEILDPFLEYESGEEI